MSASAAKRGDRTRYYDDESRTHDGLAAWVLMRLLAILLLSGASGLLYHVATSDGLRVASVTVAGNQLLSSRELEAAAAVHGANILWVRQEEVRRRLQALPAVHSVRVSAFLPNRLHIRIAERIPAAVWESAGTTYLVDEAGHILGSGSAPQHLTRIRELGAGEPKPDGDAITSAFRLQHLLPHIAMVTPREFEYSREAGVSVISDFGPRLRFGGSDDLEWKVNALVAVRREMERTGQRVELIDLRFKDRPYVR